MPWPDRRLLDVLEIEFPLIQAPMAGPVFSDMVVAVANAGGLGSLPCATLTAADARSELEAIRQQTRRPINVNFFCHAPSTPDPMREARWRERLRNYYLEVGLDPDRPVPVSNRTPFDDRLCELVEEFRPQVVSFHFGLPERRLLDRVRATGATVLSSATTVAEARWLEEHGCDAIIAQGLEAGGHRGNFLHDGLSTQVGTFALVPQVVDAVKLPVIAAGGITDARGIVAAFVLGAAAVQIGTAYLFTPEARVAAPHRLALRSRQAEETALTNVFTGRPARGIVNRVMREVGPIAADAPGFPLAGGALAPLRAATEPQGSGDFMSLWAGQAASLGREMSAGQLTRQLASEALAMLNGLALSR
ncbi:NAD(P)H-dependent flavin oxidoreductase [Tianweitania sediminis]|uniref:Nitronate monooxygenase n=1 Tax=Tianweitania sediminis TaxID=1502156 RepID=A0A8J7QWN6_9HYPH|nr:nitronate monooxygenase [Tianweitania sediminis]MBP0437993.1 nitronate monooxygenase [Tianweitania sediminis]